MGVIRLCADDFRCLRNVDIEPAGAINLISGANGAGKTSILEAVFFLGRGRSFRPGPTAGLVRHNTPTFRLYAEMQAGTKTRRVGVEAGRGPIQIRFDGQPGGTIADLAAAVPVQVIDPQVHELIQGGPEQRRRFLDWGVFHVKHRFLEAWRRYRRALQQRNSALRAGNSRDSVNAWNAELLESGISVDASRRDYLAQFQPVLASFSDRLLGQVAECRYRPGWPRDKDFAASLEASWERDAALGATQVGPHRAELRIELQDRAARHRLSRGQQKLLAAALVLAQSEFVAADQDHSVALLVDEPAAELDRGHLDALLEALPAPGLQLFITALTPDALMFAEPVRRFHVEQGKVRRLV